MAREIFCQFRGVKIFTICQVHKQTTSSRSIVHYLKYMQSCTLPAALHFPMETTSVHVFCLPRKTIKLQMYTHSDSFQYAKQRKGGRVRSFGGFTWLSIDKKASSLSSSRRVLAK